MQADNSPEPSDDDASTSAARSTSVAGGGSGYDWWATASAMKIATPSILCVCLLIAFVFSGCATTQPSAASSSNEELDKAGFEKMEQPDPYWWVPFLDASQAPIYQGH